MYFRTRYLIKKTRDVYNFKAMYNEESYLLSPEEIYAIMFRYVKLLSDLYAKANVSECVITVPAFYNYKQRQSIRDAFSLTKLKLTAMASDNTAVAAHFFKEKTDNTTQVYLFYNLGANYLQASLVKYEPEFKEINNKTKLDRYIHVLDETWEFDIGGKFFDFNLAKEIVRRYQNSDVKKSTEDVTNDYRVIQRVLPTATKVKEILSANKETTARIISIERGVNFETKITKEEFLEINAPLLDKLATPLVTLLERNNINIDDIEFVELIGGSIRIPAVQEKLIEVVGNKLGMHVNGDDSIALGAGFIAANYSSIFKMHRKFQINHGFNFNVKMQVTSPETELPLCTEESEELSVDCMRKIDKSTVVFKPRSGVGITKNVSVKHDSDVKVEILEQFDGQPETLLMTYSIFGVKAAVQKIKEIGSTGEHKINLHLHAHENGELKLRVAF